MLPDPRVFTAAEMAQAESDAFEACMEQEWLEAWMGAE
jgi:hypothetical protein